MTAGQQTLAVDQDNGGWNLNYLSFAGSGGGGTSSPLTASPSSLSFGNATASAGYTFNPSTGNTVTVTFAAATVRYVKLTFTANTGWSAGQLSELQVYSS